jgi:hypothetical protein
MTTSQWLKQISTTEFAQLGMEGVAYMKPVVVDGNQGYAIFAADGSQLAIVPTREIAAAVIRQHDLEPVSVH